MRYLCDLRFVFVLFFAVHWTAVFVRHSPDSGRRLDAGYRESLESVTRLHDRHNERVSSGSEKRFRRRVIEATNSSAFVIVFIIGSHGWLRLFPRFFLFLFLFFCFFFFFFGKKKKKKEKTEPRENHMAPNHHRSLIGNGLCVRGVYENWVDGWGERSARHWQIRYCPNRRISMLFSQCSNPRCPSILYSSKEKKIGKFTILWYK